jgi:hypothetical protein
MDEVEIRRVGYSPVEDEDGMYRKSERLPECLSKGLETSPASLGNWAKYIHVLLED